MAKARMEDVAGPNVETFVPVKTIVNQYGENVQVDRFGRDSGGDVVIAAESPADTAARQKANVSIGLAPSGNKPSGSTITRNAAVRTVNGVKIYTKEVVDAVTGEVLNTYDEAEKASVPTATTTSATGLTAAQQSANENAIELLKRTFANYGLESLAGTITDLVRKGYGGDTVSLMLQDTQAYKDRFAANEARKKAGLPVLSPAEYLATESAYRNVMQAAGLPKGFYDSSDDFKKFLENDMSPSELKQRVQTAADAIENADPLYAQQLQKLYGLSKGDMIAHTLDPQRALPLLQRRANAVNYATAAAQQGIDVNAPSAEYYAGDLGITVGQARQGFSQIAQAMPTYEKLQQIYGGTPSASLQDLQAATFGGLDETAAQQRIRKFGKQEQATFGGSSGVGQTSLGGGVAAGQL